MTQKGADGGEMRLQRVTSSNTTTRPYLATGGSPVAGGGWVRAICWTLIDVPDDLEWLRFCAQQANCWGRVNSPLRCEGDV
jgi:hypothetical protein